MDEGQRGMPPRFQLVFTIAERSVVSLSELMECRRLERDAKSAGLSSDKLEAIKKAVEKAHDSFSRQSSRLPSIPPPSIEPVAVASEPPPSAPSERPTGGFFRRRLRALGHT